VKKEFTKYRRVVDGSELESHHHYRPTVTVTEIVSDIQINVKNLGAKIIAG